MGFLDAARKPIGAYARLLTSLVAGVVIESIVGLSGNLTIVPLAVWDVTAVIYISWIWLTVWSLTPSQTEKLANKEDPNRRITDAILSFASIASLVAVALVLIQGSSANGASKGFLAGLAVVSVIISWSVIHTIYTLKYAQLYYSGSPGGVNFNQSSLPRYSDFAYLSFTLGMTFQVSDTSLTTNSMRRAVLHHAQISYFFGTIIIATTINLVVGLSK